MKDVTHGKRKYATQIRQEMTPYALSAWLLNGHHINKLCDGSEFAYCDAGICNKEQVILLEKLGALQSLSSGSMSSDSLDTLVLKKELIMIKENHSI